MKYVKLTIEWLFVFTILFAFACQEIDPIISGTEETESLESNEGSGETVVNISTNNTDDHEEAGDYTWGNSSVVGITLSGNSIQSESDGITISGNTVTITSYGNYELIGSLTDGQIIVNINEDLISEISDLGKSTVFNSNRIVRLILDGIDITNSTTSPIYIENSDKTIIVLNSNTENYITDGNSYSFVTTQEDETNAALFSNDDLTIFGGGSLIVDGNYNDGIASKDGLIIKSGNISVTSVDDGIRGKDYVVMRGGSAVVNAGGNGIKSDNEEDETSGYISIESGNINITSVGDAITAQTDVTIIDGTISVTSGGGNTGYNSSVSNKGIKAVVQLVIDGGIFSINSADDAVHSNGSITINGGEFSIASGDDAIHADSSVEINDGTIKISKSYEGIESAVIVINGGTIKLNSSDDGLNVASGNDESGSRGGPGRGFSSSGNYFIYINGGSIAITSNGDGIDANGSIVMTGGNVIVHGTTANNNSAIDYDGSFKITGGLVVAAGSSGMAQAPGPSSTQYSILLKSNTPRSAGTLFHIENSSGNNILTFKPSNNFKSVAFSSPNLSNGSSYKMYFGGTSTGTESDGLYSGGTYIGGSLYKSFTISNIVTSIN